MSNARGGLPTSLTPQVLRNILRYESQHWKIIKRRLVRKRPTLWEDMSLSDRNFYDNLHELLKDPENRHEFALATRKRGNSNRTGDLYRRIIRYYIDELRHQDTFREEIPANATYRQLIDIAQHHLDDDRLANMLWAAVEDGALSDVELSEYAAQRPRVVERLNTVVDRSAVAEETISNQWAYRLSQLRRVLGKADVQFPDLSVVEQIAECVNQLRELALAAQAERSAKFSSSLLALLREHEAILSDRPALKPYLDTMEQGPLAIEAPEDAAVVLENFDHTLRSLYEAIVRFREKSKAALDANSVERSRLLLEINQLHATETEKYSEVENLFLQLFGGTDPGVFLESAQPPVTPASSDSSERDVDVDSPSDKAETLTPCADADLGADEATVPHPEFTVGPKTQLSASDQPGEANPALHVSDETSDSDEHSDSIPYAEALSPTNADEVSRAATMQIETISSPRSNREDTTTPDTSHVITVHQDHPPVSPDTSVSEEHPPHSVAMEALNAMLSSRRFARAYWLTRADHTLGDPDLIGALSEGARIGPGDPCPGALVHFFSGLVRKDRWQKDERLLLAASVLGSCLFLDPLPQDIYQLAGELPVDGSPVGQLMQRVRELCIFQNARIRPEDLGVEPAGAARTARLDQLSSEAHNFLQRVPHIRFQYAPADFAVQYIYRAGSEWHRLHTIVIGNQINRLNEARSLVKLMDPSEVVGTLHDDAELTTLKQPLEGRARDKLTRHLHDTLALSREWIRLASAAENGDQGGDATRSTELLVALQRSLPNARNALAQAKGRGAVDALDCVLEDTETRIQGGEPKRIDPIVGDLRLLPGLVLEDDFEPAERDLGALRGAILEAEQSEPEPEALFSECLARREYRRARDIIEIFELGENAHTEYQHAINRECSHLEAALHELELKIEDAFLLGQLREDSDQNESSDDQTRNALERSQLLGVVRDARRKLGQSEGSAADDLRAISLTVDDVVDKLAMKTSRHQERLRREFDVVMNQLPDTEQGETDRHYLREAFNGCIDGNDHVAAFDLLDRGRRAAQGPEPVVRATTGRSEELELFLRRAEGYRDALATRDRFRRMEGSIRKGNTFSENAFEQLDRNRREGEARALED